MTTTGTDSGRLRLGTRGSRLALTQSGQVAEALMAAGAPGEGSGGLSIDLVTVRTDGDGDRTPLRQLGWVGRSLKEWTTRSTSPSRSAWRSRAAKTPTPPS